jgi:hypothetical protein
MPYAEWLPRLAPGWLQRKWGGGYLRAVGAEMDELRDEIAQARRAGYPTYAGMGPATDGLARMGAERGLERGTETDEVYAERLRRAWETLPRRGSPKALLLQLKILGYDYANLMYVQRSGRRVKVDVADEITITDGAIWTFDGKPAQAYAQWGLVFEIAQPSITYSSGVFSAAAARLNRIAWRWRPAQTEFMGTWIIGSGTYWGEEDWGAFNWGGTGSFIPPR